MDHDPRRYLDQAAEALKGVMTPFSVSLAQVYASMATAAAMLGPSDDELATIVAEEVGKARTHDAVVAARAEEALEILRDAQRNGPRHPGILRAIDVLTGRP